MRTDRFVERKLLLLDELHRGRSRDRLGHRSDPGHRWRQTGTVRAAMLTRNAVSVMNRRGVQINSAIALRQAKALAVQYKHDQ
jgi:hypothetical protein